MISSYGWVIDWSSEREEKQRRWVLNVWHLPEIVLAHLTRCNLSPNLPPGTVGDEFQQATVDNYVGVKKQRSRKTESQWKGKIRKEGREKWIFFGEEFYDSYLIMSRYKDGCRDQFHTSHQKQKTSNIQWSAKRLQRPMYKFHLSLRCMYEWLREVGGEVFLTNENLLTILHMGSLLYLASGFPRETFENGIFCCGTRKILFPAKGLNGV